MVQFSVCGSVLSNNFSMVAMSLIMPFRNSGLITQSTSHELFGPGWVHHAVMVTSLFTPHLTIKLILLMSYYLVLTIDKLCYLSTAREASETTRQARVWMIENMKEMVKSLTNLLTVMTNLCYFLLYFKDLPGRRWAYKRTLGPLLVPTR